MDIFLLCVATFIYAMAEVASILTCEQIVMIQGYV